MFSTGLTNIDARWENLKRTYGNAKWLEKEIEEVMSVIEGKQFVTRIMRCSYCRKTVEAIGKVEHKDGDEYIRRSFECPMCMWEILSQKLFNPSIRSLKP